MLAIANDKAAAAAMPINFIQGDAMALPFEDGSFDVLSIAFGIRNVSNPEAAFSEFFRVLRPGGRVAVLEFSQPRGPVAPLFGLYFRKVLPRIGAMISGDKGAYTYLHDSVQLFPEGSAFLDELGECGFEPLRQKRLTFGIASLYLARATA
jgi:demethylmenaquinone methyltransferase / 2-methoxy-6-polyprenyl-1,4-benzoquinol methylase